MERGGEPSYTPDQLPRPLAMSEGQAAHVDAYGVVARRACSHPTCAACLLAHCQRARKLIQCIRGPTAPLHHLRVLGGLIRWCRSNSGIRARVMGSNLDRSRNALISCLSGRGWGMSGATWARMVQ
jgi:hypothetical protein